ncbi:MAG: M16 family metallopeptidase [Thermodesulfovibrionales bacterium]
MLRILIILIVLFLFPFSGLTETREFYLDNGLKVIIIEDHKVPITTFQIWYRVGSRNEVSGKTGLSHLLEHMMFKGTPVYGPKTFSKIIQRNGGVDNAMTTKDYTMYFETLSSDRISIAIDLESDRMRNLILDPKETISERNVVMEERRLRYEDDPQNSLFELVTATAIMNHPYRNPVIGWMSDLSNLKVDDLREFYKAYYRPNNAFIVVAGDIKSDDILEKIKSAFGKEAGSVSKPQIKDVTVEPQQKGEKRLILKKEAELPYILIAYHTPSIPHEDSYALDVLSTILSGGKSSRIHRSLIYDKKIALDAGSDYSGMYKDPFLFFLWATASPGKEIAEIEKALYDEIDRIKNEPPSERELQKAKNQIESFFIFSQDSLYMQAMITGRFEVLGDWRLKDKYLEGIRKIRPEDVQRVAKKYLIEDNRTVGILIPTKDLK